MVSSPPPTIVRDLIGYGGIEELKTGGPLLPGGRGPINT
jgi:hypothetical protein